MSLLSAFDFAESMTIKKKKKKQVMFEFKTGLILIGVKRFNWIGSCLRSDQILKFWLPLA